MISFHRILAYTVRHLYLYKRSMPRLMEVFYWPVLDLLVWGFVTVYLSRQSGEVPQFVTFFLGALILWDILFRSQQGISVSFLEDVWSRNLLNIFVSPMSATEYVLSLLFLYLLETRIAPVYEFLGQRGFNDPGTLIAAVVVAPFVEEFAKALGVLRVRRFMDEPEDGLVYGGTAGLGFAATENLFYGLYFLAATDSLETSLLLIGIRSVSSAFLHASATASTGYGLAKSRLWGQSAIPWYLLAVLLHASFNLMASFGEQLSGTYGDSAALIGLVAAIAFGLLAFALVRKKIRDKDVGWHPS